MNPIDHLLLDVEGTVAPISFVRETLFPYARDYAAPFLAAHADDPEVARDLEGIEAACALEPGAPKEGAIEQITWLIERDRKTSALKSLQGKIWRDGYLSGALTAPLYADVAPSLRAAERANILLSVYSSGSVQAQKLFFAHTSEGDLSACFRAHFDTEIGSKREAASYNAIAERLGTSTARLLFLTDAIAEARAAHKAGALTTLITRPGNEPLAPGHGLPTAPDLPRALAAHNVSLGRA